MESCFVDKVCSSCCTTASGEVASRADSKSCIGRWRRWDWGLKKCIPGFFVLQISTAFSDLKSKGTVLNILFSTVLFWKSSWRLGSPKVLAWSKEAVWPHLVCRAGWGGVCSSQFRVYQLGLCPWTRKTRGRWQGSWWEGAKSCVAIFINSLFLSAGAIRSLPLSRSLLWTCCHTNGIKPLSA